MAQRSSSSTRVNHKRLNAQQIKEQEAINRERQRQDEFDRDRQNRIIANQRDKYSHVQPHVTRTGDAIPKAHQSPAPHQGTSASTTVSRGATDDVEIKVFVRECDGDTAQMFSMMEQAGRQASQPQPQRPPLVAAGGNQRQPVQKGLSNAAPPLEAPNKGQVPRYLQERKAQAAAEAAELQRIQEIEAERAKYPPGHRPVSEEERQELLAKLAQRKKELEYDLVRIPMRVDTLAVQKRRKQIETEIDEVETAIAKFSVKKQLFVPL